MSSPETDDVFSPPTEIAAAEARVEAHSAELRKELGVSDLVLTQISLLIIAANVVGALIFISARRRRLAA